MAVSEHTWSLLALEEKGGEWMGVESEWRSQSWQAGEEMESRELGEVGIGRMEAGGRDGGWGESTGETGEGRREAGGKERGFHLCLRQCLCYRHVPSTQKKAGHIGST